MSYSRLQKGLGAGVLVGAAIAIGGVFVSFDQRPAYAQACNVTKAADELSADEVDTLYACIKGKLLKAYSKGGHDVGSQYNNWKAASVRPAAPGPHGGRFLMTFVNEVGYAEYVKFAEEGAKIPAGTVIAKESFKPNKKGKVNVGPLFLMTKLDAGKAPKYGDWSYGGVKPNGKTMKVSQKFCHDCHGAFETQDALGYPDPDARVK